MAGRSRRRHGARSLVAAGTATALARPAAAHEVGGTRFDAPLPLPLLLLGAGATVALTALWVARADSAPEPPGVGPRVELPQGVPWLGRWLVRPLFGLAVVAAVLAGLGGRQVAAENAATLFVWPVWFRGLALVAVLVGSPWPLLSPWRAVYRLLCRLEGDAIALLDGYPDRLGAWPALAGFLLLFGVVEALTVVPDSPRLTAVLVAGYAGTMLAGAVLFGPPWLQRADPLSVLYRLLGRVAPLSVHRADGTRMLVLRPPWRDCRRPMASVALAAFVVATVYTVSFDGVTSTRLYPDVLAAVRGVLGAGPAVLLVVYGSGLLLFLATFGIATTVADRLGTAGGVDGPEPWAATRAFAPTVLPIAAAYEVAHNYPYVLRNLGQLWAVAVRPLAPSAEPVALVGWLSLPAFWWSQVILVVGGHLVAVVAAHRAAVDRYDALAAARRAHLPLVALMVAYTVLSLWIVSQPVVR